MLESDQVLQALREYVRTVVREEISGLTATHSARLPENLTTAQAATYAGVTPGTIRRWVKEGRVVGGGAGRELRVKRSELECLVAQGPRKSRARGFLQSPEALARVDMDRERVRKTRGRDT